MPSAFYNQFSVAVIDADGIRVRLEEEEFNIDLVGGGSLGTVESDEFGVVQDAELDDVSPGDVIEFSHATLPGTFRRVVAASIAAAEALPENNIGAFIVEDLAQVTPDAMDIWLQRLDDPDSQDVYFGRMPVDGVTGRTFHYETALLASNLRMYGNPVYNGAVKHLRHREGVTSDVEISTTIPEGSYVTSVALSMPSLFSVSGSPSGGPAASLSVTLAVQNQKKFLAGPASGADAAPTFRAIEPDDITEAVADNVAALLYSVSGTIDLTYDDLEGTLSLDVADNSIALSHLATMATASFLGRNTAGTGNVEVLSTSTARTMLSINNVENTALSTWAGSTNITTLGTITTGTWSGTEISVAKGGTGRTSHTAYAVICGGTSSTNPQQSVSGVGSAGQILTSNGAGALPTWQDAAAPSFGAQSAKTFFAGPTSGSAATPTFRAIEPDDITEAVADNVAALLYSVSGTIDLTYDDLEGTLSLDVADNSIALSHLATMATASFLGRNTAGTGNVEVLSTSTARTMLSINNVENTALSTWAGSTNITTLGTITTGTWSGTEISVAKGGTGRSSHTAYAVICGGTSSTNAQQSVASLGTAGQVLTSQGAGALPTWTSAGSGTVMGTGTPFYITMWDGIAEDTLVDSPISYNDGTATIDFDGKNVTLGTVTAGAWNGDVIPITHGGTGQQIAADAFAALSPATTRYDMIIRGSTDWHVAFPSNITTTGQFLYSIGNGTSTTTFGWRTFDFSTDGTGDLPFARLAQGSALSVLGVTGNSTADVASIAASSDHQVLRRSGTALAFGALNLASSNAVTGTLDETNGGTGLASYSQGDMLYASASNTLSALAKSGSTGMALMNRGTSNNPAWSNPLTIGRPVASGGANRVLYQDASSNLASSSNFTYTAGTQRVRVSGSVGFTGWEVQSGTPFAIYGMDATDGGTLMWHSSYNWRFATASAIDGTGFAEKARMTPAGNFKIGGSASRGTTEGTNQLVLFNGTAPVGTLTNGVSLYSASGELRVMDAAGNSTLLSPHDGDTNEWIYYSKHTPSGRVLRIHLERLLKAVNEHLGTDFVEEYFERPETAHHPRWAKTRRWDSAQQTTD